jgi:ubiquinone/menaquinone biosynthesis C-methylase UbiE
MRWFGWFRRKPNASATQASRQAEKASLVALAPGSAPAAVIAGRVRTVGVPYALPRDNEEINRLDFQHYLLRFAFQGNYAAPVGQPASILDVGCGTGRWAREMAVNFPQARVVGVDVMPPRADEAATGGATADPRPANYAFTPGNVLEGLPIPDASFDFVHMRLLFLAIPADRWPFVVREVVRVTRPGGWVELVEAGPETQGGPAVDQLLAWGTALLARRGVDANYGHRVGELLRNAGLAQVEQRDINLPLGAYGERVGTMMAADFFSGIKGLGGLMTSMGVTTADEFERVFAQAQADVNAPGVRCLAPFYIAYGQRAS